MILCGWCKKWIIDTSKIVFVEYTNLGWFYKYCFGCWSEKCLIQPVECFAFTITIKDYTYPLTTPISQPNNIDIKREDKKEYIPKNNTKPLITSKNDPKVVNINESSSSVTKQIFTVEIDEMTRAMDNYHSDSESNESEEYENEEDDKE